MSSTLINPYVLRGNERTYIPTQTHSQKLDVCLSVCDLLSSPGMKGLSGFKKINPVQFLLKLSKPHSLQMVSEEKQ